MEKLQNSNQVEICEDKELNGGVCPKGKDCTICNKKKDKPSSEFHPPLNIGAKEYVHSKKREQEKLNFNLNANEYVPKKNGGKTEDNDDEEDQEQLDMIMKDVVENDILDELEESDDEDKWYPNYKDCECCKGFVYKCKGTACESLGQCYCKMKDDCEDI